jgi:hypothetical protein
MSKKKTGMSWFQLNQLTDKELADIGIARADIDRMVWLKEDKTMRARGKPDDE